MIYQYLFLNNNKKNFYHKLGGIIYLNKITVLSSYKHIPLVVQSFRKQEVGVKTDSKIMLHLITVDLLTKCEVILFSNIGGKVWQKCWSSFNILKNSKYCRTWRWVRNITRKYMGWISHLTLKDLTITE